MNRTTHIVLIEAFFIGLIVQLLFSFITQHIYEGAYVVFIVGGLTHLLFEFTFGNLNSKWCKYSFN
jgi:hypothetical protein